MHQITTTISDLVAVQHNLLWRAGRLLLIASVIYAGVLTPKAVFAADSWFGARLIDRLAGTEPAVAFSEPVRFHGPILPPTVSAVLLEVCEERGYGEDCAQTLLGMAWKESNLIASAVGDHGAALGYFQIHYRLHKVTPACAQNLRCSAHWTIDYLEYNGYPRAKWHAVQCHNGCHAGNGYAASALRHGARLWETPSVTRSGSQLAIR
jgi:hypothetical protein